MCPFLRVVAEDGTPGPAIENPDPANRCVAMHEPVPQSLRQQELVCLSSAHVDCPRYLRGSVGLVAAPVERVAPTRTVTAATGAALALFGLAFVVSIGFVVATGGLALTAATRDLEPGWRRPWRDRDGRAKRRADSRTDRRADGGADPVARPDPIAQPEPEPEPDARPDGKADPEADIGPLCAADRLPGHAKLLHLRRAFG